MANGEAGSNGGAHIQYLEELEGWVLDERKIVTFRWLALVLSVTANTAKKMLYDFCQKQGDRKVCPTYLVMGKSHANSGNRSMEVKVVSAEALEGTKKLLQVVTAVHVYSVQAAPVVSQPADMSAQLWATDSEHSKEMLTGSTDAGANLRTHRLSGVRCPEVKDVALPDAPKPPPDHAREASPFARSGDVGKGAFPSNADKPKGKAIAPKDYFASAATGSGKGKGKTNAKEEKGESKKPAPAGGISSFFGKALPPKQEKIKSAVPVDVKSEISTESEDKASCKALPTAKGKKDGVKKELQKDGKALCSRVNGEAKAMTNRSSAKKKPRLSKLVTEDDELGSESDAGFGKGVEGAVKAGEGGSEEEEWDDSNGTDARAGAGKKCASKTSNRSLTKKTSSRKSTEHDEKVEGENGGECSNSADGAACAPPAKKTKKGRASAKGGDGDESTPGRSRKGSKATTTADDEGGAANGGKRESRGKSKRGDGGKRKGRYDSDDEGPEDEKASVSGAMDKFTARGGGNGDMPTKRTKIVLKSRTYMEGGYMKSVNEEVEVTDDDQEPLKPAHTNNTPNEPPKGDDKNVKSGAESRDASGSKGGGRAKKAGGLKSKGGKQSSMMSFFKKA